MDASTVHSVWDLPAQSVIWSWIKNAFSWSNTKLPTGMTLRNGNRKVTRIGERAMTSTLSVVVEYMWKEIVYLYSYHSGPCFSSVSSDYNESDLKLVIGNKNENEVLSYLCRTTIEYDVHVVPHVHWHHPSPCYLFCLLLDKQLFYCPVCMTVKMSFKPVVT